MYIQVHARFLKRLAPCISSESSLSLTSLQAFTFRCMCWATSTYALFLCRSTELYETIAKYFARSCNFKPYGKLPSPTHVCLWNLTQDVAHKIHHWQTLQLKKFLDACTTGKAVLIKPMFAPLPCSGCNVPLAGGAVDACLWPLWTHACGCCGRMFCNYIRSAL